MASIKEMIQAAVDLPRVPVPCPEWGAAGEGLYIRGMTGAERDAFDAEVYSRQSRKGQKDLAGLRVSMIISCTVDAEGVNVFAPADATWLVGKSGAVIERLFRAAQDASGLTKQDVEELEKNS